jgi:hypothetical protein
MDSLWRYFHFLNARYCYESGCPIACFRTNNKMTEEVSMAKKAGKDKNLSSFLGVAGFALFAAILVLLIIGIALMMLLN